MIFLPKDTRTLVSTPTVVASRFVQEIAGGKYLHLGFKSSLQKALENILAVKLPDHVVIDLSTDVAKVDKGLDQCWSHHYRIVSIKGQKPIIVGIFQGRHKTSNVSDFYEQFMQEIMDVREEGKISVGNKRISFIIRSFIADAPSRAFVLNHCGHSASHACSKCRVEGHRSTVPGFGGSMVFVGIGHPLRSDDEYPNLVDDDHHKGRCPLAPLLGLVTCVPLEGMHSVYLGNVKKVLEAKIQGKFGH